MPRGNGYAISRDLNPLLVDVESLTQLGRDARKHPPAQVRKLGKNLERFGFVAPIVIDQTGRVVAGWALVLASRQMGLTRVPAVVITDLGEAELRALRLALNRLAEDSSWDLDALALELSDIVELDADLDLRLTGFEMGEIDVSLGGNGLDEEDELPAIDENATPVTKPGGGWKLGEHLLLCGDALKAESYEILLGSDRAEMVFTDPPYNLRIDGHVSGLGRVKHPEFVMASGEMTSEAFGRFLITTFSHVVRHSTDGSIHYVCMDWRHIKEISEAGGATYSELKNLCVWNKSNAGMGSLYRSGFELVFVFKSGHAPHINNVALGRFGRHRSNVWNYPSQNALNGTSKSKLSLHPTVKPVAMIADAIRDCSNRGGIILDPFGGAGTTIVAAEKTGRRARLIELNPRYVDVSVMRWQRLTGRRAVNATTGEPFAK